MSANIVLPTLSAWAQQHLTALFQATDKDSFNDAFAAFFTKHPSLTVNGRSVSVADYKRQLLLGKTFETDAQVAFTGTVQVPSDADSPFDVRFSAVTSGPFFYAERCADYYHSTGGKRRTVRPS